MGRNVEKYIREYDRKEHAGFFASEYVQIYKLGNGVWDLIDNSVRFGFMVGYKKALRDEAKKRRTHNKEKRKPLVRAATLTKGCEIG